MILFKFTPPGLLLWCVVLHDQWLFVCFVMVVHQSLFVLSSEAGFWKNLFSLYQRHMALGFHMRFIHNYFKSCSSRQHILLNVYAFLIS